MTDTLNAAALLDTLESQIAALRAELTGEPEGGADGAPEGATDNEAGERTAPGEATQQSGRAHGIAEAQRRWGGAKTADLDADTAADDEAGSAEKPRVDATAKSGRDEARRRFNLTA